MEGTLVMSSVLMTISGTIRYQRLAIQNTRWYDSLMSFPLRDAKEARVR